MQLTKAQLKEIIREVMMEELHKEKKSNVVRKSKKDGDIGKKR